MDKFNCLQLLGWSVK